jgi:HEAT repeat protein
MDAAKALWQISKADQALAHLKQQLHAGSPHVRLHAVRLLHDIGKLPKKAVRDVIKLLGHEDFEVRRDAAEVLKKVAPELNTQ